MQKKLIALALAGLVAAPAIAQSNVTVYGIVDTFVGYSKMGDAKFSGLGNAMLNGSRIGFKGSEDLGNGLKAKFNLEQGFATDTGNSSSTKQFHRTAWVGLEGGFGFVGLGRQYGPGYYSSRNDAMAAGAFDPRAIVADGSGPTLATPGGGTVNVSPALLITSGNAQRLDNSINYQTPNMSGFTGQVIYSFGGRETETDVAGSPDKEDDNQIGLGLNYANGPLNVDYVYVNAGDTVGANELDIEEHYVGGAYDFGVVAVMASWQTQNVELNSADNDVNVWQVGAIVPVGMGNVHFAYASRDDDMVDSDSKSYSLMYSHNLSKRTIAYAAVNRTTNDSAVSRNSLISAANGAPDGESANAIGLGIRHAF